MQLPYRRGYTLLAFALFLLAGLFILDDYGISWDESIQRRHGRVSIDYAAEKLGLGPTALEPKWDLEDYQWSNYGMLYQLTGSFLELSLGYEDDPYRHYQLRHYLCFFLFFVAVIFFYRSLRLRFPRSPDQQTGALPLWGPGGERQSTVYAWLPLIGTAALVLSPRIFANGFYNPEDHVLLAFYTINAYTLLNFLDKRTWRTLVWHALATGLALNTRLPALIIPLATVCLLGFEAVTERGKWRENLVRIVAYLPLSVAFLVPFFPYLWEDTFTRLVGAFSEMSDFAWDSYVWLFGERISALDVPWYYVPAWILITTPILHLVFLFTGLYVALRRVIGSVRELRLWRSRPELFDFTMLGLAVGPILVVILLDSTLYNGWRHLHFVFPPLAFLLTVGVAHALQGWTFARPRVRWIWTGAMVSIALLQVIRYHPHQYVYFNEAIRGEPLNVRFDMDYWGVGFRDAFVQLAEDIPEGEVRTVKCEVWPCQDNLRALPPGVREKFRREGAWHKADYLATNFIWPNTRYDVRDRKEHFAYPVIELRPGGHLTIGIYDLRAARERR